MISLWFAVFVAVALFAVIGIPLAWAAGLRGFWRIAVAPAFAMTMIGGTAVVAPWIGLSWSLVPVLLVSVVVGVTIALVRRRFAEPTSAVGARFDPWLAGALIAAALIIGFRVVQIIGAPGDISQTFDNIFHLNGVRFVLDTGNASSLHLGQMTSPSGTLPFYPAAWHALVSLVVQLSGATIPVAVNAVALVTAAVVWPLGVVLFSRVVVGRRPSVGVSAALIAASIPAFPILLMDYGVLYPFQLGLALLPTALAATAALLGAGLPQRLGGTGWWALVLVGIIPGMALAHPGAFVAWLALGVPFVLWFVWKRFRAAQTTAGRVAVIAAVLAYVAVGAVLVRVLRPPAEARGWPTQMTIPDAVWQVLTASTWYLAPAFVAALAAAAGIVWALVDRTRPGLLLLATYAIGAVLFVTVAALPWGALRDALTGSWYNNLPRLAAVLTVATVPLAAYGASRTWQAVTEAVRVRSKTRAWAPGIRAGVAVVVAVALAVVLQLSAMPRAVEWASAGYRMSDTSALLTTDEYALLNRLDEHVPEGVTVAGSAWTGASLAYALADRPVLMPHTLMEMSRDINAVINGLDDATGAACRAVDELGIGFVLDFGPQEVHPGTHDMPGFDQLGSSDAVRLVDEEGAARLYEVVGCG